MALELATRLILRNADDGSPVPLKRLRAICADWAGVAELVDGDVTDAVGRAEAGVTSSTTEVENSARWTLTYAKADDDDPSVEWRTEVTAVCDPDRTTLAVRLRRESRDHRLRPLVGSPMAPRVIRDVLKDEGIACYDGPLRVGARYGALAADAVEGFMDTMLFAEDRRLPILAVAASGPNRGRLDLRKVAHDLAGFAHVHLVEGGALPRIHDHLGPLSLDRDSARLWWAGIEEDDEPLIHPHWHGPFEDPPGLAEEIRRLVFSASRDRWREPNRLVRFDRAQRQAREQQGHATVDRLEGEIERLRRETQERGEQTTLIEQMASDVADLEQRLQDAEREADEWRTLAEDADAERDRLARENLSLTGQLEGALAKLREASAAPGATEPETDEAAFAREVREAWEQRIPHDRHKHTLCAFTVRPGFVSSIRRAHADRAKVAAVAMEVACGLAPHIAGRQLHPLREHAGANAPQRKRQRDGALAWRCNLQTKSASARRLHYWALQDGSVEFANVVVHDDMSIPE